ncbi:hypothetical protein O1L60_08715 [Streptomyces diastatochromogenes]|nr:hypothetical protein [Streptomyces diastatochromogenes]
MSSTRPPRRYGAWCRAAPRRARRPGARALRITADFAAVAGRPLPELAEELRAALLGAAVEGLGLRVAAVDLRVTELLDTEPAAEPTAPRRGGPPRRRTIRSPWRSCGSRASRA